MLISELAVICEDLQKPGLAKYRPDEYKKKQKTLRKGILKLCKTGMKIWKDRPDRHQHYFLQTN